MKLKFYDKFIEIIYNGSDIGQSKPITSSFIYEFLIFNTLIFNNDLLYIASFNCDYFVIVKI